MTEIYISLGIYIKHKLGLSKENGYNLNSSLKLILLLHDNCGI
jgi:hypothetical protein